MTPRNDAYTVGSGGALYAGGGWPAWRQGMVAWEWVELTGTTMNGTNATVAPSGSTGPSSRINTWSPLVVDRVANRIYCAANGGHGDYAGNEVLQLDLSVDAPGAWTFLRQPTPSADVQDAAGATTHYLDGRCPSSHGYYSGWHVPNLGKIVKIGAGATWQTANGQSAAYAFDLGDGDWDGAGTYPNTSWASPSLSNGYAGQAQDQSTGDIYFPGPSSGGMRRFNASDSSYTSLAAIGGVNADFGYYRALAYDHTRGKLLLCGDAYLDADEGRVWTDNGSTGSWATVTFTGESTAFDGAHGFGGEFCEPVDAYIIKTATGDQVLSVDPVTWEITEQSTTGGGSIPNATNKVFGRFKYMPLLRGFFYYPAYTSNVWFLATA